MTAKTFQAGAELNGCHGCVGLTTESCFNLPPCPEGIVWVCDEISNLELLSRRVAKEAHAGQFRRDGETPYVLHCDAVANRLREKGASPKVISAGWLHDVLEETPMADVDLVRKGIPQEVVDLCVILMRQDGDAYEDYISRVLRSKEACEVKLCDILANLSDSPTDQQILKYAKALPRVVEALQRFNTTNTETKEGK